MSKLKVGRTSMLSEKQIEDQSASAPFCYKSFKIKLRVHYAQGNIAVGYFLKDHFLMDYSISKMPPMDHFEVGIFIMGSQDNSGRTESVGSLEQKAKILHQRGILYSRVILMNTSEYRHICESCLAILPIGQSGRSTQVSAAVDATSFTKWDNRQVWEVRLAVIYRLIMDYSISGTQFTVTCHTTKYKQLRSL